jgi:hypothetical protein
VWKTISASFVLTGNVANIFKNINTDSNIFKSHKLKTSIAFSGKV